MDSSHKWPIAGSFGVLFVVSLNKLLQTIEWQVIWDVMTLKWRQCEGESTAPSTSTPFPFPETMKIITPYRLDVYQFALIK